MGFDVLYLPRFIRLGVPSEGQKHTLNAAPGDPGSPWAHRRRRGGHKDIHVELGTLADLKELQRRARELDIDLALDLADQCSPTILMSKNIANGFGRGLTAPCSTRRPSQKVSGYLSVRFRERARTGACGRAQKRGLVLGGAGDPHFPRG